MELSTVAHELYGIPLREFTEARNARAAEARKAGDRELAESVKQLRKPSAGASMANLLVRAQPREIDHLIELGATLRNGRNLDGPRIRQATKKKSEVVAKLLRQARAIAKGTGLALSQPVEQELEATLDAAFSDVDSAHALRNGCLTSALHYSGLGFDVDATGQGTAPRQRTTTTAKRGKEGTDTAKITNATKALEQAKSHAKEAESEVEKARRAVKSAEADLERLRAALTVATRRARKAHELASAAQKKLDLLGN